MWFANFFIAGSMTMVLPFLSLYIETFGNYSDEFVQTWAGWIFGITFVTAFLVSPIWGRFGDRYGRKKILVISGSGLAVSVFFMGFVTSVWQLFILRFFMGVFTGFISTSQALISTQTPQHLSGRVLGTLQTGNVSGSLFGPMFGGILADAFGFSLTFKLTSITLAIAAIVVLIGIKEFRLESKGEAKKSYSRKEVLQYILFHPVLIVVMVISLLVQIAHFSIQPILALYVKEIHGLESLAFFSGIAFSITGLGNLLMTRNWGKIADKIGYEKVMVILLVASALVYFPGAFVTNIWQLLILRFLLGVFLGGIIPVRTAYIRQAAPIHIQGEVLGYNTSFRFLGNAAGPAIGGWLSGLYGISSIFFLSSTLLFIGGIVLGVISQKPFRTSRDKSVIRHS
ncbi:putative MFS family arabinose efflux permease [Melghiribacillus thermohalophilus]|uniref:Putative MFS family arabinose efflux permease n=1 Tax=Melghiribacillus thermohalophilus TaxID=1324956 RepID=A0A4R3NBU5_9BACI|nr:MFS transporter [Melghiribacillus thermohalophilus]TCT24559.1 putative MFS family arabinose efflux permease [Melghiribacillus thermohalophilus]